MTSPDWPTIERHYRAGTLSIREIARQNGVSDTAIRKRAKGGAWTKDLSARVRIQVRENLVREGSRQCELAGIKPSDAAIVDEAAAMGVAVVRSHRSDIGALREAAGELLNELAVARKLVEVSGAEDGKPVIKPLLKLTDCSRVICDLSAAMARLVPLERQAFGLDEDRPDGGDITLRWEQ